MGRSSNSIDTLVGTRVAYFDLKGSQNSLSISSSVITLGFSANVFPVNVFVSFEVLFFQGVFLWFFLMTSPTLAVIFMFFLQVVVLCLLSALINDYQTINIIDNNETK